jgi:hypothetical protein
MSNSLEQEALRLTKAKQEKFYDELTTLLIPAHRYLDANLYESRPKDRAKERLDDAALIARFAAELYGLK